MFISILKNGFTDKHNGVKDIQDVFILLPEVLKIYLIDAF